ncbi:adenosylhomocysteinase, partial [Candidatus Bathyarchaeota archaeon]
MAEEYKVKDIKLAGEGRLLIEWASRHMPVLNQIKERFTRERPLEGLRIGACLHVTKETAVLIDALRGETTGEYYWCV